MSHNAEIDKLEIRFARMLEVVVLLADGQMDTAKKLAARIVKDELGGRAASVDPVDVRPRVATLIDDDVLPKRAAPPGEGESAE